MDWPSTGLHSRLQALLGDIADDDHDYSNSDYNNYVDPRLLTGACGPGGDDAPP